MPFKCVPKLFGDDLPKFKKEQMGSAHEAMYEANI